MYVYLVIHNSNDEISNSRQLLHVCANHKVSLAYQAMEKKNYQVINDNEIIIERKRVDRKTSIFTVMESYEEAGFHFNEFLHLTTTEKRAKGRMKHISQQQHIPISTLKIQEFAVQQ